MKVWEDMKAKFKDLTDEDLKRIELVKIFINENIEYTNKKEANIYVFTCRKRT